MRRTYHRHAFLGYLADTRPGPGLTYGPFWESFVTAGLVEDRPELGGWLLSDTGRDLLARWDTAETRS